LRPRLGGNLPDAFWAVTSQRVWDDLAVDQGWTTTQYRRYATALLEAGLLPPIRRNESSDNVALLARL
jgi:hypothetical protein